MTPIDLIIAISVVVLSVIVIWALNHGTDEVSQIDNVTLTIAPGFVAGLFAVYFAYSDISAQPPKVASAQNYVSYAAVFLVWCTIMVAIAAQVVAKRCDVLRDEIFDHRIGPIEHQLGISRDNA